MRALNCELAPELAKFLLGQVAVMFNRRAGDGTAQRLRRICGHQQIADRVVLYLLDDHADAFSRHRRVGAGLDDGQHVAGLHLGQLHVTDGRVLRCSLGEQFPGGDIH